MHVAPRFNPNMLYIIRETREYSLADLASELGIEQKLMRQYAAGKAEPTKEHLEAIAELLEVLPGFFYREGIAYRQYAPLPTAWEPIFPTEADAQRKRATELLASVPDDALPEVLAALMDVAVFGEKVTRI